MKKLSLYKTMLLIVFELSLACFVIAGYGLYGLSSTESGIKDLIGVIDVKKDLWAGLGRTELILSLKEREFYTQKDAGKRNQTGAEIDELKKKLDTMIGSLETLSTGVSLEKVTEFKKTAADRWASHQGVRNLGNKGDVDGAREAFNQSKEVREKLLQLSIDGTETTEKLMHAETENLISGSYKNLQTTLVIVTLLAVCLGAVFAGLLLQRIRRAIDTIVENLTSNSKHVGSAANEFADSAAKLSQATTQQGASLQETAASTQELTSIVQRNMENAQRANAVTLTSQASAERGQGVVEEMKVAIGEIDASNQNIMEQVNESNTKISEITRVIAEIGNKTKVINDIVFQTKLLSFNASVEAARAGEHGKGFAVVAEEVGNLARMSGAAAKEISDMLDVSINKVETIVQDTKLNVERLVAISKTKVEAGTKITFSCSDVLNEIVRNISDVTRMSADIASASQEQAQGVQEIGRAMTQLDGVTQMNANSATLASKSAEDLSGQAASLQSAIGELSELVYGHKQGNPAKSAAATKAFAGPTRVSKKAAPPTENKKVVHLAHASPPKSKPAVAPPKSKSSPAPAQAVAPPKVTETPLKLAVGSDVAIPTEDDPRFKDV